ncbi:uncharacterized protein LOC143165500 [Aptenodytes patagonicus]|uniref:uncharacterized protein LOC143165500 n=1 Tax=Aptenodytes patagonicus TaxID=9234 RepID=UPI003FA01C2B
MREQHKKEVLRAALNPFGVRSQKEKSRDTVRRLKTLLDLFKSSSISGHKLYRELEGLTHPLHPAFTLTTVPPCSHKRSSALLPFLLIPSQLHGKGQTELLRGRSVKDVERE